MNLLDRMRNHDANEERHYLREGRINITWSWLWMLWGLGVNLSFDTGSDEPWSAWVTLGPLTLEVYKRGAAENGDTSA